LHDQAYYVQVRFRRGRRWVAVAIADSRAAASGLGGDAYRSAVNQRGEAPMQVRVVSLAQLQREGGSQAARVADMDIATRAHRLVDQLGKTR
jgi:hypothetical protein